MRRLIDRILWFFYAMKSCPICGRHKLLPFWRNPTCRAHIGADFDE